jgi:stress-induced morphogen
MQIEETIKNKIKEELPSSNIVVTNFSSEHMGHIDKGHHIEVTITDKSFKDKRTLQNHQTVYKILNEELKSGEIHALKINTKDE